MGGEIIAFARALAISPTWSDRSQYIMEGLVLAPILATITATGAS